MKQTETKYLCDTCKKDLTKIEHIHLENPDWFGVVKPPKWEMKGDREGYFDFCDVECFEKFITPVKKVKKTKE